MEHIRVYSPKPDQLEPVSRQIWESYRYAYRNLMSEVYLASLEPGHWLPILESGLARGDTLLVAERSGQILGTAVFGRRRWVSDCAELHAIYLSPAVIGMGIGHRLYTRAEQVMEQQNFRRCSLEVLSANERAIRFYQGHGFHKTRSLTVEENGMTLACDVMEKMLGSTPDDGSRRIEIPGNMAP